MAGKAKALLHKVVCVSGGGECARVAAEGTAKVPGAEIAHAPTCSTSAASSM